MTKQNIFPLNSHHLHKINNFKTKILCTELCNYNN